MIGLKNKKIGFIVDSSASFNGPIPDDVKIVPLCITIDSKAYKDGVDLNQNDINLALDNNKDVKTSQANIKDMIYAAQEMSNKFDIIFVFPIHAKLSSNLNTWKIVNDDFPKLQIIMTYDIVNGFCWTINKIKDFLKTNEPNKENIENYLNKEIIPNRIGWLVVNDLKQLVRGGRVSGLKSFLSKLLNIHPIILFDKNGLSNFSKAKNNEECFCKCDKYLATNYPGKTIGKAVLLTSTSINDKKFEHFKNDWIKHYGTNVKLEIGLLPSIIISHSGNNSFAQYIELKNK